MIIQENTNDEINLPGGIYFLFKSNAQIVTPSKVCKESLSFC